MKYNYKAILILVLSAAMFACEDLTEVNKNPNSPEEISSNYILTYVLSNTARTYHNLGFENSKIAGAMQYVQRGTNEGAIVVNFYGWEHESWNSYFDILRNNQIIYENAVRDNNNFFKAVALTLRSFHFGLMTDLHGDIPYNESLKADADIFFPKYDKQIDVYKGIIEDLKQANQLLANLDLSKDGINSISDIMYNGDPVKWRKFANALRMRYSMRLLNKSQEMSSVGINVQQEFSDAASFTFTGIGDDARVNFLGTDRNNSAPGGPLNSPNPNLLLKPAQTLVDKLLEINDPRLHRWVMPVQYKWDTEVAVETNIEVTNLFGEKYTVRYRPAAPDANVNTNLYVGLPIGLPIVEAMSYNKGNDEAVYHPERSPYISFVHERYRKNQDPLVSMNLITYTEVKFLMAEAAHIGGFALADPEMHYKEAIRSSMQKYAIPASIGTYNFENYYNQTAVNYGSAPDKHQRIMEQKWISSWQSVQSWFDWRRTGYPNLRPGPVTQFGDAIPVRYMYPAPNLDPKYLANYQNALNSLNVSNFMPSGQSKDHPYAMMWLIQNTGKPW
ncbi:MAG: SusD/RagB family nutrient-binding outer membrane lipoprotein [Cyclobacteriaceae bacterium]|nr:SusD/RagB family nutrient-binding outer membrane lipoprotein [Cyclobacteriaceae bacterium]